MKMVKSLLLGSAAGLVAVAGAQAADLPVKAKPVEYVKICSLYGDAFYYVPGTETCVRIGSSAQADYFYNTLGNGHPAYDAVNGARDRTGSVYSTRGRGDLAFDTRNQTSYGTLRSFVQLRMDNADVGNISPNVVRAYIQWAGWTFGHTRSYTDPVASWGGGGGYQNLHQGQIHDDSGANGTNQIAYTWELGNGLVLVFGADDRRVGSLTNLSNNVVNAAFTPQVTVGTAPVTSRAGMYNPNPYVAFRGSQAWGSFSSAFIINDNRALYYTAPNVAVSPLVNNGGSGCAASATTVAPIGSGSQTVVGSTQCGHPGDKLGWALLSGIDFNLPMIARGDRIGFFFNYGVGANQYSGGTNVGSPGLFSNNNTLALGVKTDGVYVNGSSLQLTTGWTLAGAFQHFWMPNLSTVVYAGRTSIEYNSTVINNRWFCGTGANNNTLGQGAPQAITVGANVRCDPGFKLWELGTHTDWYPIPGFRLAAEVGYIFVETAFKGEQVILTPTGGNGGTPPSVIGKRPGGIYTAQDKGIAFFALRAQRGFGAVGGE